MARRFAKIRDSAMLIGGFFMRHLFEEYGMAIVIVLLSVAVVALFCTIFEAVSAAYV